MKSKAFRIVTLLLVIAVMFTSLVGCDLLTKDDSKEDQTSSVTQNQQQTTKKKDKEKEPDDEGDEGDEGNEGDPSLILSCTETDFYVSESTTVYFYAKAETDVTEVFLYNAATDEKIATMLDDGSYTESGDDLPNDGIFSCKISYFESEAGTLAYYAYSDTEKKSNEVQISVIKPLTTEELWVLDNVNASLSNLVATSVDLPVEEKAVAVQQMLVDLSVSDYEEEAPSISQDSIYYDTQSNTVSFEYSSGVSGFIKLDDFSVGLNSTAGSGESMSAATSSKADQPLSDKTFIKTVGDAIIMYSLDDPYNSSWFSYYEDYGQEWSEDGLVTQIKATPTVEDYKTAFLGKELIVIAEHGGYVTRYNLFSVLDTTSIIFTTEQVTFEKNYQYSKDLLTRRLYIATLEDGSSVYCLTPEFFAYYYGNDRLDGSIVYMTNCAGYGMGDSFDSDFADALVDNAGADAVFGYYNSVYIAYGLEMMDDIVDALLEGKTAGEAFDAAKAALGDTDLEYVQNFYPDWTTDDHAAATPNMSGDSDAVLVTTDFLNGSFELDLEAWNTVGDVRILNKLAELVPIHGDKMAILTTGIGSAENEYIQGTEGSILLQSFIVPENITTISLWYDVVSEEPMEYVNSQYDDKVVIELLDIDGNCIYELAYETINTSTWYSIENIDFDEGDSTTYHTQWIETSFDMLGDYAGQQVTIRIRTWDVGDSIYDTAVLVDSITLQ